MKAVVCEQWCGPEDLVMTDLAVPEPGPGQVRVRMHAAGVNFADTLVIAGKYQVRPEHPFSPGFEGAGVVDSRASDVVGVTPGDRVAVLAGHGAFAQYAVVDAQRVFPIGEGLDFVEAAGFLVAYGTSHVALRQRANLREGETLLVHGAGGGVGLTAVEIGHHLGARVIATAGSQEKLDLARAHGASETINYRDESIRDRVLELTGGNGANVVYDPVGGDVFDASLRAIAWEGRLLVVGFAAGRIPQIPANYLLVKNCAAMGVYWSAYLQRDPGVMRDSLAELMRWHSEGALHPHVSQTLPLAEAGKALQLLSSRKAAGKVVLTID